MRMHDSHTHIHTHTHTQVHTHTQIHAHTHIHTYIHTRTQRLGARRAAAAELQKG